ncbi:protein EARLY FLOWERING 3 [Rosa rugosa]|uniref:protein EARLY FLOWERING 3 n=1 Tax=Rosa rugosa TaxID=74645 RepID=UPI002B40E1BB|nr:protein EARLY FLOWERING 3 [Rosa rugosa]
MKRGGRDDEKVMGPMFPRLHVNDAADKGGPRAPPRNKMALYEQLSIPSQRFNHGVMPLNQNSMGSPAFSNQGNGPERNLPLPIHGRPSTPTHHSGGQSDGVNVNMPSVQPRQRKRAGDEDDFAVPVFVQSRMGQCQSRTQNGGGNAKLTPFSQSHSDCAIKFKSASKKDNKQSSSPSLNLRREFRSETEEDLNACSSARDHSVEAATNISTREMVDVPVNVNTSPNKEYEDHPVPTFNRSCDSDACLQQNSRSGSQLNNTEQDDSLLESTRDVEKGTVSQARSVSRYGGNHSSPNEPDNDSEYHVDRMCISAQMGNADKGDDVSETSMVDSISGMDISPDDVVGIIGQKHFWKARRAIVNQQRLFAVQVFELHRLIKVQRLIAGSPHLLLEDTAFLGTSLRGSPAKKLPAEYVVKPLLLKRKHESEKSNNKMECSAENAVGKASLSSVKNGSQPSHYGPYVGSPPPPAPVPADNKAAPWCFHQPPGHQYLIPVMSPSEGLIYKPYNGPGFVGAACGGCGPFGSSSMPGNFIKPAYGVPGSHHQGMGVLPVPHPTYFPPYGMSVMNPTMSSSAVEQMNWFAGPGMHGSTDQLSGNSNLQHQSSCNMPTPKNGAIPHAMKSRASNPSELQGSTGNSPGDRAPVATDQNADESDALQLFPSVPAVPERVPQPHDTNQATQVIRVVPHNPRSATASAARIFQSIQEERKQYD